MPSERFSSTAAAQHSFRRNHHGNQLLAEFTPPGSAASGEIYDDAMLGFVGSPGVKFKTASHAATLLNND